MKILITGAYGFLGKNLTAVLECIKNGTDKANSDIKIDGIYLCGKDDGYEALFAACVECDFVFHFAGVNRTEKKEEFSKGNAEFTRFLTCALSFACNNCPIVFASSEKTEDPESDYGQSKREAEEILLSYSRESGAPVMIYRFPHIFGKWCRANYNSVVATFCYNTARSLSIDIIEPEKKISLAYIDDFVKEMLSALRGERRIGFCEISPVYEAFVSDIADTIRRFDKNVKTLKDLSSFSSDLEKKLFSTYLSYLPPDRAVVPIVSNIDERGSFSELLHGNISGQVSFNVINPGCSKGGHWHNSKCEVFVPVSGKGIVLQRKVGDDKVHETNINAENPVAVYILPGYTHSIINLSEENELSVFIWSNEEYDPSNADTYKEDV